MKNYAQQKDQHNLWRDFEDVNYQKPAFGGVHGHLWSPPMGNTQSNNGFTHISSPHAAPPSVKVDRIIANELPSPKMSASSLDLPLRKNVIQVDIPNSATTTTTYGYNAATQQAPLIKSAFHGIDTIGKRTFHGRFKQIDNATKAHLDESIQSALQQAKKVEITTGQLIGQIQGDPKNLVIPINTVNKKEKSAIDIPLK